MSEPTPQETFRQLRRKYQHALDNDRINPDVQSEIERRMNAIDRKLGRKTNESVLTLLKISVATVAAIAVKNFAEENDWL